MSLTGRGLVLLLAALSLPSAAIGHQLDEYVQATIVSIEPGEVRLKVNLTPGVLVAEPVVGLMDGNRDGAISPAEAAAYADLLRHDLALRVDGQDVDLKTTAFDFPAPADLRGGWGIVRVEFLAAASLGPGDHRLTLENRHLPDVSAYLFNAAQPTSSVIRIGRQDRNEKQSTGAIEFTVRRPASPPGAVGIGALLAALTIAVFAGVWRARKTSRFGPAAAARSARVGPTGVGG